MGCDNSKCYRNQELDLGVDCTEPTALPPTKEKQFGKINFKDYGACWSPVSKSKEQPTSCSKSGLVATSGHESTKNTRLDFSSSAYGTIEKAQTTQHYGMDFSSGELNIVIGKSSEALQSEALAIENHVKELLDHGFVSQSTRADVMSKLTLWKDDVYTPMTQKTVEIKNFLSYNFNRTELNVTHEVVGWDDLPLLRKYCSSCGLKLDQSFISACKRKMFNLASMTLSVSLQIIIDNESGSAEYCVYLQVNKPFNKQTMERLLVDNCEKENISIWYDSSLPMGNDFGYSFSLKQQMKEMLIGFYIFDESARTNLKKALGAYQSYGAKFKSEQIDVLKRIRSEELKIYLLINENGVSKVRMGLQNVSDELLSSLIENFPQKRMTKENIMKTESSLNLTAKSLDNPQGSVFYLEYSVDGFELGVQRIIGEEYGSHVHFEEP